MKKNYIRPEEADKSSLDAVRTLCVQVALEKLVCESDTPPSNAAWQWGGSGQ